MSRKNAPVLAQRNIRDPAWRSGRSGGCISVAVTEAPDPDGLRAWDALVAGTAGTDVTQLSGWARLRGRVGFGATYLLAHRDGALVGGAQVLRRRVPLLGSVGYVAYGPVIAASLPERDVACGALCDGLTALARRRLRMLFIQPPEGGDDVSRELLRRGFRTSAADIAPAGSLRLDLTACEEELRNNLGRRLRYWTTHWAGRGVVVRHGGERDVALLVELMAHTARHQGYRPLEASYVLALYRELSASGRALLLVGEVDGSPVAADLLTGCGGMMRGRLTGFDRTGPAGRLSVPGAIRWEAIRWAKAQGYRWFDFGALDPAVLRAVLDGDTSDRESWPSTDRAKLSFGGTAYRYPTAVELIRPTALRRAYDVLSESEHGRGTLAKAERFLRSSRGLGRRWSEAEA